MGSQLRPLGQPAIWCCTAYNYFLLSANKRWELSYSYAAWLMTSTRRTSRRFCDHCSDGCRLNNVSSIKWQCWCISAWIIVHQIILLHGDCCWAGHRRPGTRTADCYVLDVPRSGQDNLWWPNVYRRRSASLEQSTPVKRSRDRSLSQQTFKNILDGPRRLWCRTGGYQISVLWLFFYTEDI